MNRCARGLVVRPATAPAELDAYADVWSAVHPQTPISGAEVRRRLAARADGRRHFVAEVDGRPVGTGFASWTSTPGRATALVAVCSPFRGRGIGSALLERSLAHARELGASVVSGVVGEDALPWTERRGFREYEREVDLARDLEGDEQAGDWPPGIGIAELDPDHHDGAFAVYAEGVADIPTAEALDVSRERWLAEVDASPLVLVALEGSRVVGYAQLERRTDDVLGHELTAVARTHRRRGIARALKRAQIAWAAEHGFRRLITNTHAANEATRRLNERLGYRPLPPLVSVRKELG